MHRGDIVMADLEPVRGAEANKARPVLIVGNEASIQAALRHGRGVVTIVPITTNTARRGQMHVSLRPTRLNGLRAPSKAQTEQIRSVDLARLQQNIGRLGSDDLDAIDQALRYHLAL